MIPRHPDGRVDWPILEGALMAIGLIVLAACYFLAFLVEVTR